MFLQKSFSHSVSSLNYAVFLEKHRPLKNHIRYCKMRKWNSKSAVRYAKTQIDLSPLSTPSDLGSLNPSKVCIFFETLRSRSTPSDSASTTKPLFHRIRRRAFKFLQIPAKSFGVAWRPLAWFGSGKSPPQRAWVKMTLAGRQLPQIIYYKYYT